MVHGFPPLYLFLGIWSLRAGSFGARHSMAVQVQWAKREKLVRGSNKVE